MTAIDRHTADVDGPKVLCRYVALAGGEPRRCTRWQVIPVSISHALAI
jgi:hypothetical protein